MINLVCNMIFYLSAKNSSNMKLKRLKMLWLYVTMEKYEWLSNNNNFFASDQWSTEVNKNWKTEYWSFGNIYQTE